MAETNRFQKYVKAGGDGAPTTENANRFARYQKPEPEPEEERGFMEKAGNFGLDVLRNFNDTISFGLYPKAVDAAGDAMGVDLQQQELLEQADRENPWAGVIGDTAGYILPGMAASTGVAKAVPQLAGNTVKQIGAREAVASGGLSATDDLIRTGTVDPMGVAIDTASGGLFGAGFAGLGRVISPEARVRASGNGITDEDRIMTEYYMRSGEDLGIPLNVPEALTAANPQAAIPVKSVFDDALQTPKGSQAAQSFEATRAPMIEQAGRDMVAAVGPGVEPKVVTQAADDAIARTEDLVRNSAQPYYDAADARKLPPTWVPKGPSIEKATEALLNDAEKMDFLRMQAQLPPGTVIPRNSVLFQDAVQKELGTMGAQANKGEDNLLASIRFGAADDVTSAADRVAPEYATAREITEQGKEMVGGLLEGPMGRAAKNPTAKGQASSIFGVDNAVDAAASRRALAFMGAENPAVPRGLLANNLDSAVSSNPSNWANTALPNAHSRGLGLDLMADPQLARRLEAASMVDPYTGQSLPGFDGGIISPIVAGIRNLGKGKIAQMMGDVNTVKKLGKTGPVQRVLTTGAIGTQQTSRKRRKKLDRNR